MELDKKIKQLVDSCILEFIGKIASKYNIKAEELRQIWNGETKTPPLTVEVNQGRDTSHKFCPKILSRGKRKGEKCSKKLKPGKEFCTNHMPKASKKVVMKRHKVFKDYYCHAETGFLLKNKTDGVIGKVVLKDEEPEIVALNEDDIKKCLTWGFKFKKSE